MWATLLIEMRFVILLIFLAGTIGKAQTRASEAGLISDNDLYTSTVYDKYYTNGLELFYRYQTGHKAEAIVKRIAEFRIGQYVFNPQTRNADDIFRNDRPFAGYLFAEAGINRFYRNETVLKTAVQLGVVGPASFAEEFQRAFHGVFGYKRVYGWQHQIRNAVAVQANVFYAAKVFPDLSGDYLDFFTQGDVHAGTVFTGGTVAFMARIGIKPLLPVFSSSSYGAALQSDKDLYQKQSELFFYVAPAINYQIYDATIQGSLFNDESPVTYDLLPVRFQGEAGIKYRKQHWNLSYSFNYRGKEADNNAIKGYFYGSIVVGYLL